MLFNRKFPPASVVAMGLCVLFPLLAGEPPVAPKSVPSASDPASGFELGSSPKEVTDVMGRPDVVDKGLSFEDWSYGKSSLRIQDGRVVRWSTAGELKVSLEGEPADAVWIGCSTNQVADVVGDPTSVLDFGDRLVWRIEPYTFRFQDGKLTAFEADEKLYSPEVLEVPIVPATSGNATAQPATAAGRTAAPRHVRATRPHRAVHVRGYHRRNGVYMAPHTRPARRTHLPTQR